MPQGGVFRLEFQLRGAKIRLLADLETRARELTVMASLRVQSPEAQRKRFSVTRKRVGGGLNGPLSHGGLD